MSEKDPDKDDQEPPSSTQPHRDLDGSAKAVKKPKSSPSSKDKDNKEDPRPRSKGSKDEGEVVKSSKARRALQINSHLKNVPLAPRLALNCFLRTHT